MVGLPPHMLQQMSPQVLQALLATGNPAAAAAAALAPSLSQGSQVLDASVSASVSSSVAEQLYLQGQDPSAAQRYNLMLQYMVSTRAVQV